MLTRFWKKSKKSAGNGQCVEVRRVGNTVEVRDSKYPNVAILRFTLGEWEAFLDGAKKDEFNL